jgi:hypothetical protein
MGMSSAISGINIGSLAMHNATVSAVNGSIMDKAKGIFLMGVSSHQSFLMAIPEGGSPLPKGGRQP